MGDENVGGLVIEPIPRQLDVGDRLTAKLDVYHEQHGEDPTQVSCAFSRTLDRGTEEVYKRRITVGCDWHELDLGWLKGHGVSFVVIENREGKGMVVKPTNDEKADLAKQILLVGVVSCGAVHVVSIIRPGQFAAFEPADPSMLRVRSKNQPLKAIVHVIPG